MEKTKIIDIKNYKCIKLETKKSETYISYVFTHIVYFPDTVLTIVTLRIVVELFVKNVVCVIRSTRE
jgi:hypothetical protein